MTVHEQTRAQQATLEALALRHDSIRCTPLGDGSVRADCLDRAYEDEDAWCYGLRPTKVVPSPLMRYTTGWIVKRDGEKEAVRW